MTTYTREQLQGLFSINGGYESYAPKLIHYIGIYGPAQLMETCDALVTNQSAPEEPRELARTFRLMFRQLNFDLFTAPCKAYQLADAAWREEERTLSAWREEFQRIDSRWEALCVPARKLMTDLGTLATAWNSQFMSEIFNCTMTRLPLSASPFLSIPGEIDDFIRYRENIQQERDGLFSALNNHLCRDDGFEGVVQMEALDGALLLLDQFVDEHIRARQAATQWSPRAEKALQAKEEAYRGIARELCTLQDAGKIALVRIARLLSLEENAEFRTGLEWLLRRPVRNRDTAEPLPVTVINAETPDIEWQ
jgi:hypothetical protein